MASITSTTNPHRHEADRAVEVCACGATRAPGGKWVEAAPAAGHALVASYLANSTPEERSKNARAGAKARWKGKSQEARKEFMQYIASRPRPARRIADRCGCGKYSRVLADKRGHKCKGYV